MNSTKLFLVDLDGVVVHRADFFSNRVKELYPNANHEAIKEFFVGGDYKQTALGYKDLPVALEEVLPDWGVAVSVNEILKAWFSGENNIDEAVLEKIKKVRDTGVLCVIATDHSKYRKQDVWENLGMKNHFDGIVASADMGATKEESVFYEYAMTQFGVSDPASVLFVDDDPENVKVAESVGIRGVTFTGAESINLQALDIIEKL